MAETTRFPGCRIPFSAKASETAVRISMSTALKSHPRHQTRTVNSNASAVVRESPTKGGGASGAFSTFSFAFATSRRHFLPNSSRSA